jgi:hypothetical protein
MKVGDRVLIVGDHPWSGHSGEYIGSEKLNMLPGVTGHRVRLDVGTECFVMEEKHWKKTS